MTETIDLKKIDELDITKTEDQYEYAKIVEDLYKGSKPYIDSCSRIWDENIRFFEGDQYIYYSDTSNRYETIPSTKYNDYIPRPVTNLMFSILITIASVLTKGKPTAFAYANSENEKDLNAAKLSETIVDAKWEMDEEQLKLLDCVLMLMLCGTVFRKDYWDASSGPRSEILNGRNVGDNAVEILSPFEVILDIETDSWYLESKVKDINCVKSYYDLKDNGYTGLASEIKEGKSLSTALSYRERLRFSVASDGLSSSNDSQSAKGKVVVNECYIKPTDKYKNGLMIVEAGGVPLYINESPYYSDLVKDSWHPYTECVWVKSPLKRHGISCAEQLVPLQRRLNGIDSLIILNRLTNVSPQWLIPIGSGIPEGYITGRPSLNIFYRPINGAVPQKLGGTDVTPGVFRERERCVQDMYFVAMYNEIMSGNNPSGVNTATGYNLLHEQTFSKFSPILQRWEKFVENGQQKKLLLIQKKYKEPRPQLISRMRALNKGNTDFEIKDFIGADLRDNINIRIESGSTMARSQVAEQQTLMDLLKSNMLGDITPHGNPEANTEFLQKFGATKFSSAINNDVLMARHIVRILYKLNRGETDEPYPPVRVFDNLQIHLKILTDEMKKPGFKDEAGAFQKRLDELLNAQALQQGQQPATGELTLPPGYEEGAGGETLQGFPQNAPTPEGVGQALVPPQGGTVLPPQ